MEITKHGSQRMSQRGITKKMVDMVMEFGAVAYSHDLEHSFSYLEQCFSCGANAHSHISNNNSHTFEQQLLYSI